MSCSAYGGENENLMEKQFSDRYIKGVKKKRKGFYKVSIGL
jgi:hypothetical protein